MNSDELQTLSIAWETDLAHYGMRWERAGGNLVNCSTSQQNHEPTVAGELPSALLTFTDRRCGIRIRT